MSDAHYSTMLDDSPDDLPRTVRRERDRQARERAAAELAADHDRARTRGAERTAPPAVVTGIDIPFFRLMLFCIKAVFAAIPALLLLGILLWLGGEALKQFFPDLVKMQILIRFPH